MAYDLKMEVGRIELSTLSNLTISPFFKGLPIAAQGQTFNSFLASKPNLFKSGFQFPIAVLKEHELRNNLTRMQSFCKEMSIDIAPHVKTTMAPQIAKMQIDAGAWGITVANFYQAGVFLNFGFERVMIANEVLDPLAIQKIAEENLNPKLQIMFFIDSLQALHVAEKALEGIPDGKLYLFIEVGADNGRAGLRNVQEVLPIAEEIKKNPRLHLLGVSGYEGIIPVADRSDSGTADLRIFCRKMVEAGKIISEHLGKPDIILTAGGSAYFDIAVEELRKFGASGHIIIRSGGYVSHDHGGYELIYPFAGEKPGKTFLPAIELWARVLSHPEPHLAILNLGKRDVGNDIGEPLPIKQMRATESKVKPFHGVIDHLNDQHAYLELAGVKDVDVDDLIGLGISHPCTTFDKWRLMALVDESYDVVDFIHTFF